MPMDEEAAKQILMNQDETVIAAIEELVRRMGSDKFVGYIRGLQDGRHTRVNILRRDADADTTPPA